MTTESSTAEEIARELGEHNLDARRQVSLIVEALGQVASLELVERAMEIEGEGGEPVLDGSRRRTPSGIFFRLARERLPQDAVEQIFRGKSGRPPPPGAPPSEGPPAEADVPEVPPLEVAQRPPVRRRVIDVRRELPETPPVAVSPSPLEVARAKVRAALASLDTALQRAVLEQLVSELDGEKPASAQASAERRKRVSAANRAIQASFVVSMPVDLPVKRVVERAREHGIRLTARDVNEIRAALRRRRS